MTDAERIAHVLPIDVRVAIAAVRVFSRARIAHCDRVIRGDVELHGTDLPEAMAERRALRVVIRMLEGVEA